LGLGLSDFKNSSSAKLRGLKTPSDSDATTISNEAGSEQPQPNLGAIGAYRLLAKLGEGGMGSVWLADQSAPVKRRVAIKIVKFARFSEHALRRFDLERQSLAIMNHPAIAKVFDAGSTSEGQPYFVMEYVDGLPITSYCNQKRLDTSERVELMIKVCEGVQHAHQKAILHRDLKPSNILVIEIDGKPVPRIIDFGIAKATQALDDDEATRFTQTGGLLGTPGYMSPEQADPSIADVDTRTDVYSLGVILYELLTASLPFDPKLWKTKPFHEVLRQLHEEDPKAPSTRISTDSAQAAQNSGTEPQYLITQVRGDLDWITLKALERDRERRYHSPADLAADLTRYLHDEPITARPPTLPYRLQKFVRRNSLAVTFAAAVAALIIGFAVMMAIERNHARREAEVSRRVSDFMSEMFTVSDPSESRGNTVTAREILDKASTRIDKGLEKDPQVQTRLMYTMAATYRGLGLYSEAKTLLEHALAIQKRAFGAKNPETLKTMALLGDVEKGRGKFSEAEQLLRQAMTDQEQALGPDDPETMATVNLLTDVLNAEGHDAEAEGLLLRTLASQERTLGPENGATLRTRRSLMQNLNFQGRFAEAEKFGRETLAIEQRVLGADHPGTLWTMNQLGLILQAEGRFPQAEQLFRETLTTATRVLGPDHNNTRAALSNLGVTLYMEGRFPEAEAIERQDLEQTRKIEGPEHPDTINSMNNLAITLAKEGKLNDSEKLLREALETAIRTLGPNANETLLSMGNLATTLAYEKRTDESLAMFEKLMESSSKAEGSARIDANYAYAGGLTILGHRDEALHHLEEAVKLGFRNATLLRTDDELQSLHGDPRFQALLAQIEQKKQDSLK
jgi:non-specific serine/threonine protein kinase/serine/threonine-protein kinase